VNLSTPTRTTLARVAADQLLFSPTNLLCFLSTMSYLEGASVTDRLRSTYTTGLKANWMVWPWVQLANFGMVPLEHRVLVVYVVALGWNCYLSYLNGQGAAGSKGSKGES
jgi:protein Mpv17